MWPLFYTVVALLYLWVGSSSTKYVVRLRHDALRAALLSVTFPAHLVVYPTSYVWYCLEQRELPARLLTATFWLMPVAVFWAAWDGFFVSDN
jgi:hypothetical protein